MTWAGDLDLQDWMRAGRCKGRIDVEWVANDAQRGNRKKFNPAPALAICATCPVKTQCLEYAIEKNADGVWGGTIYAERWRIRRARRMQQVI